jgi:hypothetical protein
MPAACPLSAFPDIRVRKVRASEASVILCRRFGCARDCMMSLRMMIVDYSGGTT